MEKDYRGRWFFRNADGRAVPACGYRPEDITDDTAETADEYFERRAPVEKRYGSAEASRVSAETPSPSTNGFTGNKPSAETWTVREPASEIYCREKISDHRVPAETCWFVEEIRADRARRRDWRLAFTPTDRGDLVNPFTASQ